MLHSHASQISSLPRAPLSSVLSLGINFENTAAFYFHRAYKTSPSLSPALSVSLGAAAPRICAHTMELKHNMCVTNLLPERANAASRAPEFFWRKLF